MIEESKLTFHRVLQRNGTDMLRKEEEGAVQGDHNILEIIIVMIDEMIELMGVVVSNPIMTDIEVMIDIMKGGKYLIGVMIIVTIGFVTTKSLPKMNSEDLQKEGGIDKIAATITGMIEIIGIEMIDIERIATTSTVEEAKKMRVDEVITARRSDVTQDQGQGPGLEGDQGLLVPAPLEAEMILRDQRGEGKREISIIRKERIKRRNITSHLIDVRANIDIGATAEVVAGIGDSFKYNISSCFKYFYCGCFLVNKNELPKGLQ